MSNDQDKQILERVAEGDSKSFAILVEKYQNLVFGYCIKMMKNRQKAEDVTQETWIRVIKNAGTYKPTGSVRAWIMSIASNLVIDEFRSNKKFADLDDAQWNPIEDSQPDLEAIFEKNQRSELLKQAFDELTESQRVILTLILIEELSQSEVSVRLNISVGAVKASLFRARETLKKRVEGL